MGPSCSISSRRRKNPRHDLRLTLVTLLAVLATTFAAAQDKDLLLPGVTYVCSGERMFIENCNMRDTSDNSTCMVGHPDHIQPNGLMKYTTETRGTLKKLFPTCTQPSPKEIAAAQAFQKRQQDTYNANVAKANQQMAAPQPGPNGQPGVTGPITPPKNAEEREMRRCVSSGRLPASCTGNQLLGAFGQMLNSVASQVAPGLIKDGPTSGPTMAGVFVGPGNWRLDFIDGGVLVNCSFLSPNQEAYALDFKTGRAVLTINTTPKPLVLTFHSDNTITGPPGPVTINGVVAGGYTPGTTTAGHTETSTTTSTERINAYQAPGYNQSQLTNTGGGTYDATTTHTTTTNVPGTSTPGYTNFAPKRATCPAINLSTKGATVGVQTMQTDLLKNMFGGDKGAPTPPGIRMKGIYAASTGFSVEFYPESVILGCGPDAARAYPYTVEAGATGAAIKIAAPDHPLTLAFKSDGSLDPGATGPYQVHGRIVTGQNNDGDFTFAPMEQTCNLAVLAPSKTIPSGGGTAATMVASAATPPSGNPAADSRRHSRHSRIQQRRHALCPRRHPRQRHAIPHLRISRATRRSQPACRPSLHHPARQLRQHSRKSRSHRSARNVSLQIRRHCLHEPHPGLPEGKRRRQSQRHISRPRRCQRHWNPPRRSPRHLLPDDLRPLQQSRPRMGPADTTQSRHKLPGPQSKQRNPAQLRAATAWH